MYNLILLWLPTKNKETGSELFVRQIFYSGTAYNFSFLPIIGTLIISKHLVQARVPWRSGNPTPVSSFLLRMPR